MMQFRIGFLQKGDPLNSCSILGRMCKYEFIRGFLNRKQIINHYIDGLKFLEELENIYSVLGKAMEKEWMNTIGQLLF